MPATPSRRAGGGGCRPSARTLGGGTLRLRRAEAGSNDDRGRASRVRAGEVGALQGAAVVQLRRGATQDRNGKNPKVRLTWARAGHRPSVERGRAQLPVVTRPCRPRPARAGSAPSTTAASAAVHRTGRL